MKCLDCSTAAEQMHHGFAAGCIGCCARAAARSQQYRRARDSGVQHRDYRVLLEQFGLTHDQVKDAAANDALIASAATHKPAHGGYPEAAP